MITDRFGSISEIPHICTYCDLRHEMCGFPVPYNNNPCRHFVLGGCFTCKLGGYDGAKDENIAEGKPCVYAMVYDYERCRNYKKDKALWKEYKQTKKS